MRRLLAIALAALAASIASVAAQVYPSRPITIIVPTTAGGPPDTIARLLGERMRATLGQPVIVENVTGAGGTLSIARVVRAAPDGYTASIGHLNSHVFSGATYSLSYDLLNDLEPVTLLTTAPLVLVARNALPPNDLPDLIAWLKANPNKASLGTVGMGGPARVWGTYFQKGTGTQFQFVPYRGAATIVQDLVAGQIDLACVEGSNIVPHLAGGKIKTYAVPDQDPLGGSPRHTDDRRGRVTGILRAVLAWTVDAEEHRPRRHRQAQWCRCGGLGRSGGAGAACETWSGNLPARTADAGGAGCVSQGGDREVVADHQGGQHQARISIRTVSQADSIMVSPGRAHWT
jgi:tripartite-type tricarboxylate transporter receptor subunit TctC